MVTQLLPFPKLATAINAASGQGSTSGAGTTYIAQSAANQLTLKNAGVTAVATATTLTITTMRYVTISESLGNVTAGTYTENILAGIRNAVEIVLPSNGFHSRREVCYWIQRYRAYNYTGTWRARILQES